MTASGDVTPTSRGVDARYAAGRFARSVDVIGHGPVVEARLRELAAVGSLADRAELADLLLMAPQRLDRAPAGRVTTVLLDSSLEPLPALRRARAVIRARRTLRGAGYRIEDLLVGRDGDTVRSLAPIRHRRALAYAARWVSHPSGGARGLVWRALRTRLGGRVLALSGRAMVVASRTGGRPAVMDLVPAADRGVGEWVLLLSPGDELTRVVLITLDADGVPVAAAKTARTSAGRAAFDREAGALDAAARAGVPGVPRVLARGELDGLPVTVEQAMPGELLGRMLERTDATAGLAHLERAAAWAETLGASTGRPPEQLRAVRAGLADTLAPRWPEARDIVAGLPPLPGVLAHNDLGTWNVLVTPDAVSVVDWESAADPGLPLWDLIYLLTDGLALIDGVRGHAARAEHALALHSGHLASSPWFFERLRRAAAATGVPVSAVGSLATLCWLHHGLSYGDRAGRGVGAGTASVPSAGRLGPAWLADARLGRKWPAFEQSRA